MIILLFFLTLITMSNCRPSALTSKNETVCSSACDPIDKIPIDGSGSSEAVLDSDEEFIVDKCDPGDDCDDVSTVSPIDRILVEGSDSSEAVLDSDEEFIVKKCKPGDDCDDVSTVSPIDRILVEGSDSSEAVLDSDEEFIVKKCKPGDDCDDVTTSTPVPRTATVPSPCKTNCSSDCCCPTYITYNNSIVNYTSPTFINSTIFSNFVDLSYKTINSSSTLPCKTTSSSDCCCPTHITYNNPIVNYFYPVFINSTLYSNSIK